MHNRFIGWQEVQTTTNEGTKIMFKIKVAKIKVSKAIINQFQYPSLEVLQTANVIGVVINVVKGQYKTLILELNGSYYKIQVRDWHQIEGKDYWLFVDSTWTKFDSKADATEWLTAYNRCKNAENASVQLFV